MRRDETLSRSLMLLCFGTAIALFFALPQTNSTIKQAGNRDSQDGVSSARFAPREPNNKPVPQSVSRSRLAKPTAANIDNAELVVDLSDRRVYVYRTGKLKAKYPIAVGQKGWQTPTGTFPVLAKYRNPSWLHPITGEVVKTGPKNPLGDRWIGFWSDGRHQIGFHGTNQEKMVGQAVSHGCLRMRNQDIRALYEQVGKGTPVVVRN
ncbi:L,D-transpeptidase [Microcoleus sp. FACHB-831]|uniref:L,D-transpeptidase n=1 Tax=Microcoleus sp. FACHB-831 TaxID=2692827 RepID=UPI00168882F4|nr:L,D-transpeptidase [Microcoleus sp. FACHB-831]MBD1924049.1 L,D-transpeptidase [Microcoleus sp. FACHB-831]